MKGHCAGVAQWPFFYVTMTMKYGNNSEIKRARIEDGNIAKIDKERRTYSKKPKSPERPNSLLRVPIIDLVVYRAKILEVAAIRAM